MSSLPVSVPASFPLCLPYSGCPHHFPFLHLPVSALPITSHVGPSSRFISFPCQTPSFPTSVSFTFHLKATVTYHLRDPPIPSHFSPLITSLLWTPHHPPSLYLHHFPSLCLITFHLWSSSQPSNTCCFCPFITFHPCTLITSYTCPPITFPLCTPITSCLGTLTSPRFHQLLS